MNIAIVGYGKMGKEIEKILRARNHNVALIIDENNASDLNQEMLAARGVEVAIEFTTPATAFQNIMTCLKSGVGVVCGTTGWLDRLEEVKSFCTEQKSAFFYSSNYSIGVNIFYKINELLAGMMNAFPAYDVTVEETHHTQKKDAPSGTAITIAEGILKHLDRKEKWVAATTTTPNELEVTSVRRSVVPGIHTVTYESEADVISLTHSAKSRQGFAMGAVMAAEFIRGKSGLFSMDDLIGL